MATNGVSEGNVLAITASGAVTSSSVQEVGADIIGVALNAASGSGVVYPLAVEGIYEVTKLAGLAWSAGDKIYWSAADAKASPVYSSAYDNLLGIATAAATSGAVVGSVKLRGGADADVNQNDAVLTASSVATVAAGNVIGGIPVVFMIALAAAAGNNATVMTHKIRVLAVQAIKTDEAGLSGGTLTISNVANAITNAMTWDNTTVDKAIVPAASIDDARWEVAAGAELRCVTTQGQSRGTVVVTAVRVV